MADLVIAIDGPAASGKSTVAGLVAEKLNAIYVNTGNMYRAVALSMLKQGLMTANDCTNDKLLPILKEIKIDYEANAEGEYELSLNGEFPGQALRTAEVAALASPVSALECVRDFLLDLQRSFAGDRLIVMEGRDIGSVIFPDAKYKFFITATPEERARRRFAQEGEVATGTSFADVVKAIEKRDRADSTRKIAPLKAMDDATIIDTTEMAIPEVVQKIVDEVKNDA